MPPSMIVRFFAAKPSPSYSRLPCPSGINGSSTRTNLSLADFLSLFVRQKRLFAIYIAAVQRLKKAVDNPVNVFVLDDNR